MHVKDSSSSKNSRLEKLYANEITDQTERSDVKFELFDIETKFREMFSILKFIV